jgi:hypothetical protein
MTRKYDNPYLGYLAPLGYIKSDDQPDRMRVRYVDPKGRIVYVLPSTKYVGLGTGDIRYEWELIPLEGESLHRSIRGDGHLRLLGALALLDLDLARLEEFVALAREEAKRYANPGHVA